MNKLDIVSDDFQPVDYFNDSQYLGITSYRNNNNRMKMNWFSKKECVYVTNVLDATKDFYLKHSKRERERLFYLKTFI